MTLPGRSQLRLFAKASLASLVFALLTGCGIGDVDHSAKLTPTLFKGQVHGGQNPVTYALVSFYETANTGVATATSASGNGIYIPATPLTALGSTYTDINSDFSFSTPLACANANDYVYVTAAGGNPGDNAINPNLLMMAAVGSCSSFGGSTNVFINELTTVAAAYALSGFTSISGTYTTGNGTNVSESGSAPAYAGGDATLQTGTNSFVSGQLVNFQGCENGSGQSTTPSGFVPIVSATSSTVTIAGTYDAALNSCVMTPILVTASPKVSVTSTATNYLGAYASGSYAPTASSLAGLAHAFANAANLVNSVAGTANTTDPSNSAAILPTSLINALGNSLQGCVNTSGGTSSSMATAGCGKLFYNTIITTTTSSGTTTNTPVNTLQAALNIAHAPTRNVTNILAVAPSTGAAFVPAVTSPTDLSMAIAYPALSGTSNSKTSCSSNTGTTANGLCYPQALTVDYADNVYVLNSTDSSDDDANVVSFTSDGANRFGSSVSSSYSYPFQIAVDNLGNVFFDSLGADELVKLASASTSTSPAVSAYSTTGDPVALAIDTGNNVYNAPYANTSNNLYKYAPTGYSATLIGHSGSGTALKQLAIDASGNIWGAQDDAGGSAVTTVGLIGGTTASTNKAELIASGTGAQDSYGVAVDSSGNAWATSPSNIYKVTHTGSGTSITAAASASVYSSGNNLSAANFDGNNNFLTVDSGNNTLDFMPTLPTTLTLQTLKPCLSGMATTCPAVSAAGIDDPVWAQGDSTGSFWVANGGNGSVVQVIGTGSPAWPLAEQKPGVMP
jgi:hypothetical protein